MSSKRSVTVHSKVKGVIYDDYDEDTRGRRKKSKPTPVTKAIGDIIVEAPNQQEVNAFVREELAQLIIAEEDGIGFEGDLTSYNKRIRTSLRGFRPKKSYAYLEKISQLSPNERLRQWVDSYCDRYLDALFQAHAPPLAESCERCHGVTTQLYTCNHCVGHQSLCSNCLVLSHQLLPTHQISAWNGKHWETSTLRALGLVMHLGHRGAPCSESSHKEPQKLLVGDTTGFQEISVRYCAHHDAPPAFIQLLCVGLFPCSDDTPKTAFTVMCLEHYDLFQTIGSLSAQKYYDILVKLTSSGFPEDVKDRYRELHLAGQRFCHLKNLKRSGSTYERHVFEEAVDDHTVPCIACPSPGFNYDPRNVPPVLLPFIRMWVSFDGNFANSRKAKRVDGDDMCLSDDLQYYVGHKAYEEWAKAGGKERVPNSKPECDNHKAAKSDTYGIWGGLDVTGVGLFSCTRHTVGLARGLVDFFKGEKHRYTDYAFGTMVNFKLRRGPHKFGMTYDIWCHWVVNLWKRAKHFPTHISLPSFLDLIGGIPKWHLVGHHRICHIRYSLNYTQHCGRMDGEGPERFWAYLNQTCGSTSEKSPGYRRDTINNLIDNWNFSKLIGMGKHIKSCFLVAKKMFLKQRAVFEELDAWLSPEVTNKWNEEQTEAMMVEGKWESPFYEREVPVESLAETLQTEKAQESGDSHTPGRKPGSAQWIVSAINIEHEMQRIRKLGTDLGRTPTDEELETLAGERNALSAAQATHLQQAQAYMGDIGDPTHPDRRMSKNIEPEHAELGLPSSYALADLTKQGLSSVINLEIRLRKAMCDNALQALRNLLGAKAAKLKFITGKGKIPGERIVTKSQARLKEHNKKISLVQWQYNNSRNALIRLGLSEQDMQQYKTITPDDLKYLKVYLKEESGSIGEGFRSVPWLWRTSRVVDDDDWQVEAFKTEWFRSRERYRRWEEELYILKREAITARNSLKSLGAIWAYKSESETSRLGMRAYAAKKSRFFHDLEARFREKCEHVVLDPIVTIGWDSEEEAWKTGSSYQNVPHDIDWYVLLQ